MKLVLVTLMICLNVMQYDYRAEFTFDYDWAVKFMFDYKESFIEKSQKYGTDNAIMTSVVFPEIIRYSIFRNYFETKGLELIYVRHGKDCADFSIGYFQMKPSFVEKLELYIMLNDSLKHKYDHIIRYKYKKAEKIRWERLERIKSIDWQIEYLCCFYSLVSQNFQQIKANDKEDKIRFYATAYNHGFDKPAREIYKWMNVAVFPYGMKSKSRQYVYSDISVEFYKKTYPQIFHSNQR